MQTDVDINLFDLDFQYIARLGVGDCNRPGKDMSPGATIFHLVVDRCVVGGNVLRCHSTWLRTAQSARRSKAFECGPFAGVDGQNWLGFRPVIAPRTVDGLAGRKTGTPCATVAQSAASGQTRQHFMRTPPVDELRSSSDIFFKLDEFDYCREWNHTRVLWNPTDDDGAQNVVVSGLPKRKRPNNTADRDRRARA